MVPPLRDICFDTSKVSASATVLCRAEQVPDAGDHLAAGHILRCITLLTWKECRSSVTETVAAESHLQAMLSCRQMNSRSSMLLCNLGVLSVSVVDDPLHECPPRHGGILIAAFDEFTRMALMLGFSMETSKLVLVMNGQCCAGFQLKYLISQISTSQEAG